MKRSMWIVAIVAAALLGVTLYSQARNPRIDEAELRLVVKQEQRERADLDQQWKVIMHPAELVADQKRWETATESVCRPTSESIEHQIESSRCKAKRYRLRQAYLREIGTN